MFGGKLSFWRIAVGVLFGVVGVAAEACEPAPATVTATSDGPMRVWPATEDGLAPVGPPAYETDESTLDLPPGCWVVKLEIPQPLGGLWIVESSRPFTGLDPWETQHAVCLEPGETATLDRPLFGARDPRPLNTVWFVRADGQLIRDEIVVTVETRGEAAPVELLVDDGVLDFWALGDCPTILDVGHPVYEFPSLIGVDSCEGLTTLSFAFGVDPAAPYEPARVLLDLEDWTGRPAEERPLRYVVTFTEQSTGWVYGFDEIALPGLNSYDVPAGCYEIKLFIAGQAMMAEVTRSVRFFRDICVEQGEEQALSGGDLVGARFSGDAPFIPVVVVDGSGNPVPGVQVDFFYPRGELTNEEARNVDHSVTDARGVFYDSTTTGENGRSLLPHYAECLVATAIAPPGYQFSTGEYARSTVCEGDTLTLEVQATAP